ncbi:MAG: hypothetical protein UX75_C0004G0036 [Candidatus Moranbacteria bacterium GW2011_GWE2_47_10]|nr:MAG: hypothetical protein UX75_C0004G0036 [Candidatus Moranbacteria bacterium GW2011_GWE2_47_10]
MKKNALVLTIVVILLLTGFLLYRQFMVNNEPEPQVQIKNEANGGSQITVEEILEIQKKAVEETQQNESVDSSENVPSIEEIMEQQKKASSEAVSSEPEQGVTVEDILEMQRKAVGN